MRSALLRFLRTAHLIGLADRAVAEQAAYRLRDANTAYQKAHPNRAFPEPTLVHEVAGHASLQVFDESGAAHASLIARWLLEAGLVPAPRILEWGCGPARILSHLPAALGDRAARFFGCDPDDQAIRFAARAHADISFQRSAPLPPAPYGAGAFDAIYGVSILTHLDEATASAWAGELARLVAASGIVLVTAHGEKAAARLGASEKRAFESGRYIALGGARMGSRTYVSYFNEAAGRRLFAPFFTDITHRPDDSVGLGQDVWLLRRPRAA